MEVTVQLPDEIAKQLGGEGGLSRRVVEAVALEGYRASQLSRGQVSELLGLSFAETEGFLNRHQAFLQYCLEDLEADRATLKRILAAK